MTLILKPPDERARPLEPTEILQEVTLQDYVVENPEILPFTELRNDLQFLVVAKELATDSGPIDAAGVDDEGNVYLIETKLFRNSDKRRVVAQVLDYGAALWREHGVARTFVDKLDDACTRLLGEGLASALGRRFKLDGESVDDLMQSVETVVQEGGFRFVVLMDRLDDSLKDLVSFINENSRFDVYAVELELYAFDGYEAVIPRLHGTEARKVVNGSSTRRRWNEDRFFANAEKHLSPEAVAGLRRLHDSSKHHADRVTWGTGYSKGSFNPKYDHIGPKSVFSAYSTGRIDLNFAWHHDEDEPLPQPLRRMAERLRQIPGLTIPEGYETTHHQLWIEDWVDHVDEVIAVLEATLGRQGDAGD